MGDEKGVVRDQASDERKDSYKIAYVIHFLLGAGNLLPWNAFITAVDYFAYLYLTKHIEKVFAVAYMSSSVPVLVTVLSWGGWSNKLSYRLRMNLGFAMFVLSLMVAPLLDWTWSGSKGRRNGGFVIMVAAVVTCGIADGLIGGSLIGSAGKLPKQYMQAVFAGTAASGVLISVLQITTKASLPKNSQGLQASAHFYFIVSTSVLLCCILCCNLLHKLPVMTMERHYKHLSGDTSCPRPKFCHVARKICWAAFSIVMIYVVTLSIFPGFLAENLSSKLLQDWYLILLITEYNVLKSIKKAIVSCMLRLLFYPLFAACLHGPKWPKTETPVIVLTFTLGITNGYLTSILMILAPKLVPVSEAELSAIVMVMFLGIGLVGGSVIGWF